MTDRLPSKSRASEAAGYSLLPGVSPPRSALEQDPALGSVVEEMLRAGRKLNERVDPLNSASAQRLIRRRLPRVYPRGTLHPIDVRLASVVINAGRLYLEGATVGVGLSTLLTDFANGFNVRASTIGDPQRILYVRIYPGTRSVPKFLDQLSTGLRSPISTTELRFRSPAVLADRIVAAARLTGVATIIFDHVGSAGGDVLRAVSHLLLAADPRHATLLNPAEIEHMGWRIGIILADAQPAEAVFAHVPEALLALSEGTATLQPYSTVEHMADALRQADIGLKDFDLSSRDDLALAEALLEETDGLVARLTPLLEIMDLVARTSRIDRPDLTCLRAAVRVVPKLVKREATKHPFFPEELVHDLIVRTPSKHIPVAEEDEDSAQRATVHELSEKLKEIQATRHIARAEGRAINRRDHR